MNIKSLTHPKDLTGTRFGMLCVIGKSNKQDKWHTAWDCSCDCGTKKPVTRSNLVNGSTVSCGCKRASNFKNNNYNHKHGFRNTPEYNVWRSLKKRCLLKNHKQFKNYGGRGITVCKRWLDSFENFINDMGVRPTSKHSIEREDNNGNYEPGNCRWATSKEQGNNRRNNVVLSLDGESLTIAQWAEKTNQPAMRLYKRKEAGWSNRNIILGKNNDFN